MTGVNMYGGWGGMLSSLSPLAESMLAIHSTRDQVETSNSPFPYKSDKKLLLYVDSIGARLMHGGDS